MNEQSMSHRSYRASASSIFATSLLPAILLLSPAMVFAQSSSPESDWELACSTEIVAQSPSGEVTTAIKQTNIMVKKAGEILVSQDSEDFRAQTISTFDLERLSFSTSGPADSSPGPRFEISHHDGTWLLLVAPYMSPEEIEKAIAESGKPPRVSVILSFCDEL